MKKYPLISFCIATYKREKFLVDTIKSILEQNYKNIEIVVSDNDPEGSSRSIVNSFQSRKVRYYKNQKNLGMVKNFNNALSHAKGDFITFVADDDPIEKDMLTTLMKLYYKYPNADSFFGACSIYINDKKTAMLYGLKEGLTSLQSKLKKRNEVTVYNPDTFLNNFLNYNVLSYFLWSTGFVRRKLVKKIGGMPDYGSPFLTDYVYLCLVGCLGTMVIINKPLGRQILHYSNYGRTIHHLSTLPKAIKGFNKMLEPFVKKYHLQNSFERFITNWVIDHLVEMFNFSKKAGYNVDKQQLVKIYINISNSFPYFRIRTTELISKIYAPVIFIPFWKIIDKVSRKFKYKMSILTVNLLKPKSFK